ncbi:c-type cytochrome [Brevibacillus humidisoli]|uniref:c-type cytochrome n=1 Tax=Brevibacillus humidisoli TaxID=2895522 RepID=UPI001E35DE45|nr:c-type cytochrome [Brevibacillus humidisoli]UFJ40020.1 c-type cytochrome [Brevibacillus humidisoli]
MKRITLTLLSAVIALAVSACGGGEQAEPPAEQAPAEQPPADQPPAEEPAETAPSGEAGEFDAETASALFKQRCAGCHGQELEGLNGPALTNVGATYSQEEILEIIKNGKGGAMPGNLVTGEDADNLAAWLASKK